MNTLTFTEDRDFREYEEIHIGLSVVGFTESKRIPTSGDLKEARARTVFCQLEQGAIRYRMDGIDPTGSMGFLMEVGDSFQLTGISNIRRFRVVRASVGRLRSIIASDAKLLVHYGF